MQKAGLRNPGLDYINFAIILAILLFLWMN
jgi:hypothetical protein